MAQPVGDELTILDAAALVGRSAETIRRWVWTGRLTARKSGKRLLVLRRDVEALVGQRNQSFSLREWAKLAEQTIRRPKRGGRSAATLVLEDRRMRSTEIDASY